MVTDQKPFMKITVIIQINVLSYKISLDFNSLIIFPLFYLHDDHHVWVVQLCQVTFPKAVLPTAGLRASGSGCKEQISWELISQNTKTQLTPCKAFWANTAE